MPRAKVLKEQSKELVLRLHDFFKKENLNDGPLIPLSQYRERVSAALCISSTTLSRITKDSCGSSGLKNNKISSHQKKLQHPSKVTAIEDFDTDAIHCHIIDYYQRKNIPTFKKVVKSLRSSGLFKGEKSLLAHVLKSMGFVYKKCGKVKILAESHNIALSRCEFLRQALAIDDWSYVVFMKETWIDVNHTQSNTGINDDEFTYEVSKRKAERLIVCHARTEKGFMPEALLAFECKGTGDYHEEITSDVYENWFKETLISLEGPSIIFIENAPYNTRQINKIPTLANKKSEIVNWLRDNGEYVDESLLKVELLKQVKTKNQIKQYVVDEMAAENGHTVLRIPPYHNAYNALGIIWGQVKELVAANNSMPFSSEKMLEILHLSCAKLTSEDWVNAIEITKMKMLSDWNRDLAFDNLCTENLVNNFAQESSDDSSSEEESDESL